jgi:hypothetical protein
VEKKLLHVDCFYYDNPRPFAEMETEYAARCYGVEVTEAEYNRILRAKLKEPHMRNEMVNQIEAFLGFMRTENP